MKSYTDIEQSKVLSKILPLESADMRYSPLGDNMHPWVWTDTFIEKDAIPCWSLAALISVLPKGYSLGRRTNGKFYVCMTHIKHKISEFDNPVDACYEMILKLHELKCCDYG